MSRGFRLFLGVVVSNAAGLSFCVVAHYLKVWGWAWWSQVVGLPSLLLVPVFVGAVAAWIWSSLKLGIGQMVIFTTITWLVGIAGAAVILKEGVICLVIVSPILYVGLLMGALVTAGWFERRRDRLNAFLAPVAAVVILAEPSFRQSKSSVVVDEIRIEAPAAKVWPHVLAFEAISAQPDYWLFGLGLPYPVETTNNGNYVGADRACVFSGGAVFREKVAELEPEKLLTFDIVEQPADPELIGHLDSRRGQFELRANADGSTTLIGRTWYTLHVHPAWYFDLWTHHIFRAVHLRVMNNVKRLAEEGR